jgi:hypothetical protein
MAKPRVKAVRRSAVLEPDAVGIDIGAQEIYVAVPLDREEQATRMFTNFTCDLQALGDWLHECRIHNPEDERPAREAAGVAYVPHSQRNKSHKAGSTPSISKRTPRALMERGNARSVSHLISSPEITRWLAESHAIYQPKPLSIASSNTFFGSPVYCQNISPCSFLLFTYFARTISVSASL